VSASGDFEPARRRSKLAAREFETRRLFLASGRPFRSLQERPLGRPCRSSSFLDPLAVGQHAGDEQEISAGQFRTAAADAIDDGGGSGGVEERARETEK
jgi:hypothetical protein